jgi:response regulator RpfG family c-di-GMP phosphodiesterase
VLSRILIVDEDAATRGLLANWLQGAGYNCAIAGQSDEALDLAGAEPPDAAIVGVDLPGKDGMWLARHLRKRTDDVGVILLAGTPSFAGGVTAMRMGVNDYLLKPCTREDVLEAVDRALAWRSSVQRDRAGRELLQEAIGLAQDRARGAAVEAAPEAASAMAALMAMLRTRLPETYEHSRRVARIAGRIADGMRISGALRADIEHAALLHDVGKIAIPDALLHKAGPLTEDEKECLRSHAALGFDIVSALPSLQRLSHLVVATHERYDGSGYPSSLCAEEIPLGARIIAVADTYDALAYGRKYRAAIAVDDINAELVRCAGTHFDPEVVRVWLRLDEAPLCS